MKKEVILVPKDKCLLEILSEMGNRLRSSWIFLHINAIISLAQIEGVSVKDGKPRGATIYTWEETKEHSKVVINVDFYSSSANWKQVIYISASEIDYNIPPVDPEEIYFLKMDN